MNGIEIRETYYLLVGLKHPDFVLLLPAIEYVDAAGIAEGLLIVREIGPHRVYSEEYIPREDDVWTREELESWIYPQDAEGRVPVGPDTATT